MASESGPGGVSHRRCPTKRPKMSSSSDLQRCREAPRHGQGFRKVRSRYPKSAQPIVSSSLHFAPWTRQLVLRYFPFDSVICHRPPTSFSRLCTQDFASNVDWRREKTNAGPQLTICIAIHSALLLCRDRVCPISSLDLCQ